MRLSRRDLLGGVLASLAGCAAPHPAPGPTSRAAVSVSVSGSVPVPVSAPVPALPLLRAFPALAPRLPHLRLGSFPTPLDRAEALGRAIGVDSLWVKRDDVAGARYGGGKTRKLELLLAEARAQHARTVITFGAVGSNQAVATAIHAAELGMKALLLLLPGPREARVRDNLLAAHHAGADIRLSPVPARAEAAARRIALRGGDPAPYLIPTGGSTPLGNAAFANAAFELRAQVDAGVMPSPDVIYVALGTMGSAAGLAVGLHAAGLRCQLVAVRASNPGTSSEPAFHAAMKETSAFLRAGDATFPAPAIASTTRIAARHLGHGYGLPTAEGLRAIDLARAHAGLELEPVYTAKALAALVADAPRLAGKVVLFWNTHNSRRLELGDADWRALPRELHLYFAT